MISEMTDESHPYFDMLCVIAEKTLKARVSYWCRINPDLSGRNMEEDIMQDIFIRLIKTATNGFLIREDHNWEINRNPNEFISWMFTVAKNIVKDNANRLRRQGFKESVFSEFEENTIVDRQDEKNRLKSDRQDELSKSFDFVLNLDKKIYIILSWLAQNLLVLEFGITKIKAIGFMEEKLSDKTLFELAELVIYYLKRISWLRVSEDQFQRIKNALNTEYEGMRFGNYQYKEFYMKKGGKASISDWISKINKMIEGLK